MGGEKPLEVTADAFVVSGFPVGIRKCLLRQTGFQLQQVRERLLAVFGITMQVNGAPSSILTVEELVWTLQFVVVVLGSAAVGAAPVLDDVPVGALAAIASGDGPLVKTRGVEAANDVATLFGKVARQNTLVLQAP